MKRVVLPIGFVMATLFVVGCVSPGASSPSVQTGPDPVVGHLETRQSNVELTVGTFDRAARRPQGDADDRDGDGVVDLREMRAGELVADVDPAMIDAR